MKNLAILTKVILIAIAAISYQSCIKDSSLLTAHITKAIVGQKDSDILTFNSVDDYKEAMESFYASADKEAWVLPVDPAGFESAYDFYNQATAEAERLYYETADPSTPEEIIESQKVLTGFLKKWEGKISIHDDGSLDPLYNWGFFNRIVGTEGVVKVGKEFWQIFRDGIVKAPERDLLPIMNASRISPDAVGEELTFVEFNIFAKRLETKRTDYPHTDDCNTQDGPRRVKGYLNGLFYYDGTVDLP